MATYRRAGAVGPVTRAYPDPRGALFGRRDLVYGSQIGAWDTNGGTAVNNATASSNVTAARLRLVRWQMWRQPCALFPGNPSCQTTADVNAVLDWIVGVAGRQALVGLPPIWDQQYPAGSDPWSYAWQEWLLDRAVAKGVRLFEMANEPDNYGTLTGQQYYDQLWTGVPTLKKHARAGGAEVFFGGPAWANSLSGNLTEIQAWLTACKNGYLAAGNDRDYLPDFVSTHCYLVTPTDNDTQAHAQAKIDQWAGFYASLRSAVLTTFAGLRDKGYPVADQVRLVCSEYNATIDNASTVNDSSTWTDFYVGAMADMFRGAGIWVGVQFTIASHTGGALDLLATDGTAKPLYTSLKNRATSDRENPP